MGLFKYKFSKRHLAKTFSWRFLATTDTVIISYIISGDISAGLQIGFIEIITKMLLYYTHERLWFKSNVLNYKIRHLVKTITWRLVGTIDTVIISFFIFSDISIGLKIGLVETLTKMLLYYFHEKIWYRISYGLNSRNVK